jgi:hypothetical protein
MLNGRTIATATSSDSDLGCPPPETWARDGAIASGLSNYDASAANRRAQKGLLQKRRGPA